MKWHVWVTGYPDSMVEVEEGMPMSAITAMAHAARELKAHHHGEMIVINACHFDDHGQGAGTVQQRTVRIHSDGRFEIARFI